MGKYKHNVNYDLVETLLETDRNLRLEEGLQGIEQFLGELDQYSIYDVRFAVEKMKEEFELQRGLVNYAEVVLDEYFDKRRNEQFQRYLLNLREK
ncbi:MAG: hypothetical protein LPK26_04800 [Bacillaceae bacterium]|nr:hypothetical protein [Bacillaceae bacterium]